MCVLWGQGVRNPITQRLTQPVHYNAWLYSTLCLIKYWSNHRCLLVLAIPSALLKENCVAFSKPNIFDKHL